MEMWRRRMTDGGWERCGDEWYEGSSGAQLATGGDRDGAKYG
jgi:hypothetical protein